MPKILVRGAELHYEEAGSGPEAVLFSHGLLLSTRMWDAQVEAFRDRYRCLAYDHRGQGQSELAPDGYDMDALAEDAAALVERLGAAPVHFVGLSMGGFVGMRLAARRPDLVRTLALLETSAAAEPREHVPRYRMLSLLFRIFGMGLVAPRVMNILFGRKFMADPAREVERRRWRDLIGRNRPAGVSRALGGVLGRGPVLDELGRIRAPTLVLVGDQDVATVPAEARRIHAAVAGSRLVVIPGAGHSSPIEEPALVNAELGRFWSEAR